MNEARRKAQMQGLAARLSGYSEKANEVTTQSMGSGIKNPQQGYSGKKKKRRFVYVESKQMAEEVAKSLTEWFREEWVDLSRPKPGGGYEPCGRSDASSGKYPKCVPASRAARMTPEQIASAIRRKRRAESTQRRQGKKPINVSTIKKAVRNVPTNPQLYARVKAEAKRKFDVYPSAYANAWLVREYKKRGGGYRTVNKFEEIAKLAEDISFQEGMVANALAALAQMYGPFDAEGSGIWIEYESPEENDEKEIGVKCANCVLYAGDGKCKILSQEVEEEGKCRFALIPDGVVTSDEDDMEENGEEMKTEGMEPGLTPRQQMQYEFLEQIAEKYGKWDQGEGSNGAHYMPASSNPFKDRGMICANCVYYEGGQGCEIVSGKIEPEAICKLWIIDEALITRPE